MVSLSWRSIFSRNFDLILPSFFFNFAFLDLVRPGWDTGFLPSFSLDFEFDEWVLFFVVVFFFGRSYFFTRSAALGRRRFFFRLAI